MWIELAHYILLFAMVTIGLQALILSPTLYSKGSAVAIKLGFRAACFSTALLSVSFLIILYCYVAKDFSLAVVFENFSTQTSSFLAMSAFCSSREGLFFILLILLSLFSISGFKIQDLSTYQERGRYLFGTSAVLFFLLILMTATSNPFIRIQDPTLEGLGLDSNWEPPYKTIKTICSLSAYSLLMATFIKMVSMYSKGWHFTYPAFINTLTALILLILSLGLELSTRFIMTENSDLWIWTPAAVLQLSLLCLTLGQILLLYLCQINRVFSKWAVFFSFCTAALFSADFFAAEYSLFVLNPNEAYFPNPVIAVCGTAGIISFLLFFCSCLSDKPLPENSFCFSARESFIGLAATICLSFGLCTGLLSFTPALFLFQADLPFRILPSLLKSMMFWHFVVFAALLSIAFRRQPVTGGWIHPRKKTALWFWGSVLLFLAFYIPAEKNNFQVIFWSLPGLFLFWSTLDALDFSFSRFPKKPKELWQRLKTISMQSYGFFCLSAGILLFSFFLSTALVKGTEKSEIRPIASSIRLDAFLVRIDSLSGKSEENRIKYLLNFETDSANRSVSVVKGDKSFQWPEKKLNIKAVHVKEMTARIVELTQSSENEITVLSRVYPGLRFAWNSFFFIEFGLILLLLAWKRKTIL